MTEKQKMLAGEMYNPSDAELLAERMRARKLSKKYNNSEPDAVEERKELLRELIPDQGNSLYIEPPFFCDYGGNIKIGNNVYFNFNCVILDICPVTIGDNCMFAPGVQIYAATHPVKASERNSGLEYGEPITIGNNVWVGGNVTITPGATIGDGCVIGAGSVVTKNIPANSVAVGNPARVIKTIEQ